MREFALGDAPHTCRHDDRNGSEFS